MQSYTVLANSTRFLMLPLTERPYDSGTFSQTRAMVCRTECAVTLGFTNGGKFDWELPVPDVDCEVNLVNFVVQRGGGSEE